MEKCSIIKETSLRLPFTYNTENYVIVWCVVLYHLAQLQLAQGLEAGARHQARPCQPGVAAVADTGRGLETVFELDGEYFELITVVKNFGHVKLGDEDCGVGLLMDNKLQTNFLEILCPLAVFKVVADAGEHGVRVADPDRELVFTLQC